MAEKKERLTCDVVRIHGMTCTSCEVIIERQLKKIPGVVQVTVNHATGRCKIYSQPNTELQLSEVKRLITDKGYSVELWQSEESTQPTTASAARSRDWVELGAMLVIVFALYSILTAAGVLSFSTTINQSLGFGAVFVIGLIAATSTCIAVVGGLLLTVAAKHNELHPTATGWQKFKPHILFNLGRLAAYFLLGGVVGLIGKAITPSPRFTGFLTIAISIVMIFLAVDILKLFKTKRLIPRLPKRLSHRIHALSEHDRPWVPLALGGLTFFLPCGFTQSMQLYALTTGSFWLGSLTMLVFALGTLPALLGLGVMSSFARGTAARYFLKFSGVVVLILGIANLGNGLNLAGINLPNLFPAASSVAASSGRVELQDGKQVITMAVDGLTYTPAQFTLKRGVPVEWHIDGSRAEGCTQVMTIPQLNLSQYLSTDQDNVMRFTPQHTGALAFMCSMGMVRGTFTVVD